MQMESIGFLDKLDHYTYSISSYLSLEHLCSMPGGRKGSVEIWYPVLVSHTILLPVFSFLCVAFLLYRNYAGIPYCILAVQNSQCNVILLSVFSRCILAVKNYQCNVILSYYHGAL